VGFDWVDDFCKNYKPHALIYKMIEKMLPTSCNLNGEFKLMELWANDSNPRTNWIKIKAQVEAEDTTPLSVTPI